MSTRAIILLVDDDEQVRDLIRQYLEMQDYAVLEACCGDDALDVLRAGGRVDLLLTDVVMPGKLDGFALSRHAQQLRPGIPVLHVTGYADQLSVRPGLADKDVVLRKPFRQKDLLDRVAHLLGEWAVDRNPPLKDAYTHWRKIANNRQLPHRWDLDPTELKSILPNLTILEVVREPNASIRYRCRLVGTQVTETLGFNPTGKFIDECLDADYARFMSDLLRDVTVGQQPLYAASAFRATDAGVSTERLFLPFSTGTAEVRQIIIVQTFDRTPRAGTFHELMRQNVPRSDNIERPPVVAGRDGLGTTAPS